MEKNNEPINRVSIWRKSRMKKDGTFDEKDGAKEIEAQLSTKISALTPEESQDEVAINKVFVDIIGEDGHGRVRCMGIGVSPSLRRSKLNDYAIDIEKIITEHKEQKEEINFLHEKVLKQEQMMIEQQQMMVEMMRMMQNRKTSHRDDVRNSEHTVSSSIGEGNEDHMENIDSRDIN